MVRVNNKQGNDKDKIQSGGFSEREKEEVEMGWNTGNSNDLW